MSSPTESSPILTASLDAALRPTAWGEYVGQKQVKANVLIALEAAKKRGAMPEPFLFVGATTRIADLSGPLRSRFGGGTYQLDFYTEEDLRDIIRRSASLLGLTMPEEVVEKIAARSRATPRVANALIKRIRDYAE